MADSAECWPNETSKASLYHQGKSTATFHLSKMLWYYERRLYTASHVIAAMFILDKEVGLSKSESKNTIDLYD